MSQKGGSREAFVTNLTGSGNAPESIVNTSTSATVAGVNTPGGTAPGLPMHEGKEILGQTKRAVGTQSLVEIHRDATNNNFTGSLPTPIKVDLLEVTLVDHPDRIFVSNLLQTFRQGANIGFLGSRTARFSKNLPTALAQPDVVKQIWIKKFPLVG